jgi:hypothetical protein
MSLSPILPRRFAGRGTFLPVLALLALALPPTAPARAAGQAHAHGVATLEVAIEAHRVEVELDSPLDNLVGFERAPRTPAEKQRVEAALRQLRDAARMVAIDPAAGCRVAEAHFASAVLGLGDEAQPAPGGAAAAHDAPKGQGHAGHDDHDAGHAELSARYVFDCTDAGRAAHIDIGLFAFKGMSRLDAQVVTPRGQLKRTLRRATPRLLLGR